MNVFSTLVWLEFRKGAGWLVALLGIVGLALWAVLRVQDTPFAATPASVESLGLRFLYISLAATAGVVILLLSMVFTSRQDGTLVLLSVPDGSRHLWARFAYYAVFSALFLVLLSVVLWWALSRAQVALSLGAALYLVVYNLVSFWLPMVAAVLLIRQVNLSFALGRMAWLANLVMLVGILNLGGLGILLLGNIAYTLPALPFPTITALGFDINAEVGLLEIGLPLELPILGVLTTTLFVWLAGRIWNEVEA